MTANQAKELLTTLPADTTDSTRKSVSDTMIAMGKVQPKMEEKLSNTTDPKLVEIVVEVMEELRVKLLQIWAQGPTASAYSEKTVNDFVNALTTWTETLYTEQKKVSFLDNLTVRNALAQALLAPLVEKYEVSAQASVSNTVGVTGKVLNKK